MKLLVEVEIDENNIIKKLETILNNTPSDTNICTVDRETVLHSMLLLKNLTKKNDCNISDLCCNDNCESEEINCINCRLFLREEADLENICEDCDEHADFRGFEPRLIETDNEWIPCKYQLPKEYGIYQATIKRLSDNHTWSQQLVFNDGKWYWNEEDDVLNEAFNVLAYCLMKRKYIEK